MTASAGAAGGHALPTRNAFFVPEPYAGKHPGAHKRTGASQKGSP